MFRSVQCIIIKQLQLQVNVNGFGRRTWLHSLESYHSDWMIIYLVEKTNTQECEDFLNLFILSFQKLSERERLESITCSLVEFVLELDPRVVRDLTDKEKIGLPVKTKSVQESG